MDDSYIYYARWGDVVGVERAREVRFDPRERPWYRGVGDADGVVISDAYVFSGIDRPGVTLSRRITTDDGTTLGVFGADLSNATLSRFLDQSRIGSHGIVFILDRDGRLIGYPDPATSYSAPSSFDRRRGRRSRDFTRPSAREPDRAAPARLVQAAGCVAKIVSAVTAWLHGAASPGACCAWPVGAVCWLPQSRRLR
jgi:hypothetical protein